jgi:hypothetical protein
MGDFRAIAIILLIIFFLLIVVYTITLSMKSQDISGARVETTEDVITYVSDLISKTPHKNGLSKELVTQRKDIVQRNLDLIHLANLEQQTLRKQNDNHSVVTFTANRFIPYTYEEIIGLYTGLLIPPEFRQISFSNRNLVGINPMVQMNNGGSFEIDFDKIPGTEQKRDIFYGLSPPLLTKPQDQGTCGSCWAFSACSVISAQVTKSYVAEQPANLSVQYYIDCVKENFGCEGGFPVYVYNKVADDGFVVFDIDKPYVQEKKNCIVPTSTQKLPINFKGIIAFSKDDVRYFPKGSDPTRAVKYRSVELSVPSAELKEKIKKILFTYGPLTTFIFVNDKLPYISSGIFKSTNMLNGKIVEPNHAVVIAGYGIDLDGDNYWIIRNSWGSDWAQGGYFQLSTDSPIAGITLPIIGDDIPPLIQSRSDVPFGNEPPSRRSTEIQPSSSIVNSINRSSGKKSKTKNYYARNYREILDINIS